MKKKILVSSGGSGGHVIPALVFCDHLKKNFEVFLTLDKRGSRFVDQNKYNFDILSSPRFTFNLLKLPIEIIMLIISILKSIYLLKIKNINVVLGTGGYMSFPICIAAKILNIKIYLFEPNTVVGRANKLLLKICNKIFCYSDKIINFPLKSKYKIILIPNLLRKETYNFSNFEKEKIKNKIKLLIIGGSQGAKIFDEELKNSILEVSKKYKLKVYQQVSSNNYEILENFYYKNNIENTLFNFKENIHEYMLEANLAISRAGASTLSELVYFKVPFVAIPYKFATDNHQLHNARNYKEKNCCWILEEKEFNQHKLTELLISIIENKDDYFSIKNNLEKLCYENTWNNINQKIINSINEN